MQIFMQVLAGARPPVNQVGHLREIQSCQTRWAQLAVVVQIQQIGVCILVQKPADPLRVALSCGCKQGSAAMHVLCIGVDHPLEISEQQVNHGGMIVAARLPKPGPDQIRWGGTAVRAHGSTRGRKRSVTCHHQSGAAPCALQVRVSAVVQQDSDCVCVTGCACPHQRGAWRQGKKR